jgi:DUF4097 and DUF4098 domain-containing protein YvlB
MTNWDFPCSEPIDISVDSWSSGSIAVSGEPTSTVVVEVAPSHRGADVDDLLAQVQVTFEDGQLYVHGPRLGTFRRKKGLDLTIKAPEGSSCAAKTASADVSCIGAISALTVQTASGDVAADSVSGDVTVHSASGDVMLNKAAGNMTVNTASGDIQATRVDGTARINSASGDVAIGYCSSSVSAHTASGDIELNAVASGQVELISASGDMEVAVVPGIGVYMDLASTSGSVRSDLDPGDGDAGSATVDIKCRTLSGDIRIVKARNLTGQPALAETADPPAADQDQATEQENEQ